MRNLAPVIASCRKCPVSRQEYTDGTTIKLFTDRIEEMLQKRNMSQVDFAEKCGLSPQAMNRIIHGTINSLSAERLYLFAAALDCSPRYLVGEEKEGEGHYLRTEAGCITPIVPAEQNLIVLVSCLRKIANDEVFIDYICQLIQSNTSSNHLIERWKRVMEDARFVEKREPNIVLPVDWQFDEFDE